MKEEINWFTISGSRNEIFGYMIEKDLRENIVVCRKYQVLAQSGGSILCKSKTHIKSFKTLLVEPDLELPQRE